MSPDLERLAVAVGLGLLVGFQREWEGRHHIGVRTFPLIAAVGCLSGFVADAHVGLVTAAALLVIGAQLAVSQARAKSSHGEAGSESPALGLTTEVAAVATFCVGAVVATGRLEVGVATGGALAVLLHGKGPLHALADRASQDDVRAIIRWALIAFVILPLLPDTDYGPYQTINPFEIWLMVVLIVSISLISYLVSKFVGADKGSVVAGLLGGLISSTATTVSTSRRAAKGNVGARVGTFVVLTASAVGFGRVIVEVAVVAPEALRDMAAPFAVYAVWSVIVVGVAWWTARDAGPIESDAEDPSELGPALVFGGLYAVVLVGVAAAEAHLDDQGLYLLAAVSGLTDVDAITLSSAQMLAKGRIEADVGWRMILIGALANNVFKAGVVMALGHARIARRAAVGFAATLVGGGLLLWLWPH